MFLDDGAGFTVRCGFFNDGTAHFLILGILALIACIFLALAGFGIFLFPVAARSFMLLPSTE